MHSYAQIARAYADNTERLATAFDSLYAILTDRQKQAADTVPKQACAASSREPGVHAVCGNFETTDSHTIMKSDLWSSVC
jgi:hypothetical protein